MKNTQPQNQHIIQLFFLKRIFNEEKCNFLYEQKRSLKEKEINGINEKQK